MNMIFNPANNNRLTIEICEDSAEVTMQLFAENIVAQ